MLIRIEIESDNCYCCCVSGFVFHHRFLCQSAHGTGTRNGYASMLLMMDCVSISSYVKQFMQV